MIAGTMPARSRPAGWLVLATGVLAATCLVLAVTETTLWAHYLIDTGESISLVGLLFILGAGLALFQQGRLHASLPLVFPWLLYPVITQGDQIIDNLPIDLMRAICQVLLAALFAMPVWVMVLGARFLLAPRGGGGAAPLRSWTRWIPGLRAIELGRTRQGGAMLASACFVLELWVAARYLGVLMEITLGVMIVAALLRARTPERARPAPGAGSSGRERFALAVLLIGVASSCALFYGYKNRTGAYQGSPSHFMDPSQPDAQYPLGRLAVPPTPSTWILPPESVHLAFAAYGATLERLLEGYHLLDRNYTYDFHNELFLRHTPLVANYRAVGLEKVAEARGLRARADELAARSRPSLGESDPLAALLDDVRGYVAFTLDRSPQLERMSGEFERTKAGLQHAAHLYEGEGKFLGVQLRELLKKHAAVLRSSVARPATAELTFAGHRIEEMYAHRVVGF